MRGNETHIVVRDGERDLRFPIPMRGNESALERDGELSGPAKFPIPMRGNEAVKVKPDAELPKFPIPMRGNEVVVDVGAGEPRAAFPIPMRGNETGAHSGISAVDVCSRSP